MATSNDIQSLPPELIRKGRLDEIFFVDLPDLHERELIAGIHLRKRGLDENRIDAGQLARATEGFTGAEIEQAIVAAIYTAAAEEAAVTTAHILSAVTGTQPISVTRAEEIEALRDWARGRAVTAH